MKNLIALFLLCFSLNSFSSLQLNNRTQVPGFGEIQYRNPLSRNAQGKSVVLLHGIYAGSTSSTWKELLPLLDQNGFKVYVVDLPGVGLNGNTLKKTYSMEDIDLFITSFLKNVVKTPSVLIAESLVTNNALMVAGDNLSLVEKVILLSPTGINSLAYPMPGQEALFQQFSQNENFAISFYQSVYTTSNLEFFLKKTVYNDALITPERIQETQSASTPGQMWLTLNFVGGKLTRPFQVSSAKVSQPTLMIFGEEAESSGTSDDLLEDPSLFLSLRPDFELSMIPLCGQSVHREKPNMTAQIITEFINRN